MIYLFTILTVFQAISQDAPLDVEALKQAVVSIWDGEECIGTGFLISPDGYLLTNAHVVQGREVVRVRLQTGERLEATVEEDKLAFQPEDRGKDLALLRVEGEDLPWLRLGDSDRVRETDKVTVLGFPEPENLGCEREPTTTKGNINALNVPVEVEGRVYTGLIQIDAQVKPGSSGSPVLDAQGEVIGIIVVGIPDPRSPFFFAIPINVAIETFVDTFKQILPPYPPEITFIAFPPEIVADGQPHEGRIGFRDLNGDLALVRFEQIEAEGITVQPALEIFVQAFPELRDKIEGEIKFQISTDRPQERVRLQVTLFDVLGNRSETREIQFRSRDPFSPPEVTFIKFPEEIAADGRDHDGQVGFRDPDGDIVGVLFTVEATNPEAVIFKPSRNFDPEIGGKTEGIIPFTIATTVPQEVTFTVTLTDARGKDNGAQPLEARSWSFRAIEVQPPPGSRPRLQVLPATLRFQGELGGSLAPQVLQIANVGGGTLTWNAGADVPWIQLDPVEGELRTGETVRVEVSINLAGSGLTSGSHEGRITVSAPEAENSPQVVLVILEIVGPQPRPVADFSAEPTNGPAPLTVRFTNLSRNFTSSLWDFGDGQTSTETNPTHTYEQSGTFTVKLTVRGPGGEDTITKANLITVNPRGALEVCPSGCPFSTLEAALDAARDGDTIFVRAGTYQGNWVINQSVTLKGEDKERVTLEGVEPSQAVITVSGVAQVTIEGFTIRAEVLQGKVTGIGVHGFAEVTIRNNRITRVFGGTHPLGYNQASGIVVGGFAKATIANNEISETGCQGISVGGGTEVVIEGNTLTRTGCESIAIAQQAWATIRGNTISRNALGISLGGIAGSDIDVEISVNTITQNLMFGVELGIFECEPGSPFVTETFNGTVRGGGNTIEGNGGRDVCPEALEFLKTPEGGQYP